MFSRAISLFACFMVAAGVMVRAGESDTKQLLAPLATFPTTLDTWQGRASAPLDPESLAVLKLDDYLTRAYVSGGAVAGLYIGYWGSQRQGDSIHSPLNCLPGAGWEPVEKATIDVAVRDSSSSPARLVSINQYVIQKGLDRELVLYWYQSHGRVVASEYVNKIALVDDAIRRRRTDAAIVRIIVPIAAEGGQQVALEQGVRFVQAVFPALTRYLPS